MGRRLGVITLRDRVTTLKSVSQARPFNRTQGDRDNEGGRSRRLAGTLVILAAMAFAALGAASLAAAQGPAIKIGALYNLTGAMSSIDEPALNGARLAVEEINRRGGLLGRPVELVAIDTKTDQQAAATGARLVLGQGVVAGIGYGDTTFVLAAAPLFQSAGVPFVTSGATHPDIPNLVGDYMFMTPFGDDAQAAAVADFAYQRLGTRTVWVLTDTNTDFTLALSKFFKERFTRLAGPRAIVLEDFYQTGDTDYSSQIARLQALQPQPHALFVSAIPGDAGVIVKQIRERGIRLPILSGDGFDTPLVVEVPGPSLAYDVYFSTHTSYENPAPAVRHFVEAYTQRYGRAPENAFAALGYDALNLVARAIERAGSAEPKAIRDALAREAGYDGATGRIAYGPGQRKPTKAVTIIHVDRGRYRYAAEVTP